jgi:hypothetical protein
MWITFMAVCSVRQKTGRIDDASGYRGEQIINFDMLEDSHLRARGKDRTNLFKRPEQLVGAVWALKHRETKVSI